MGARFPTALQLVAFTRKPSLVSAVVAGDEIVAAALADLTREEGVRVGRIWLLASFLGDEELDRRLKWALLLGLQATFRRLRAKRLELWTDRDDGRVRMILRRVGDRSMPVEFRTGPAETRPRLRLVRSCHREGSSVGAFPHAMASVTVTSNST